MSQKDKDARTTAILIGLVIFGMVMGLLHIRGY